MHEIKSKDWAAFCGRVTQECKGATLSLEFQQRGGPRVQLAHEEPLREMAFGASDACRDAISLRLGDKREIAHSIMEPIRIWLEAHDGSKDYNTIQIDGEEGITFLRLNRSIHPAALQGFEVR